MQPFFSIIIPVYNVAPYLRACLEGVLAQSFGDWECLCVDDGATDGSGAILDEYAKRDARFRVFHQRNGGVSAARNRALGLVRGEFVCFVDGDDVPYPWWLKVFAHFQQVCGADLIRTQFPHYLPYDGTPPALESVARRCLQGGRRCCPGGGMLFVGMGILFFMLYGGRVWWAHVS